MNLCHIWLSLPRTKTSIRLGPHEVAPGSPARTPPRDVAALHVLPFHVVCHRALSAPRMKTSAWFEAQEDASGPDVHAPPNEVQMLAKPMLNDLITVREGTYTEPPASAGVTNRLIPKAALW